MASQKELTGEDGTKATVRTLGIRDALRFARIVACTTRADPDAGGGVRDGGAGILRAMGAVEPKPVRIAGRDAVEGTVENDHTEAMAQVVSIDAGHCLIMAEYSSRMAVELRPRARAFLKSVRIGSPMGVPTTVGSPRR